MPVSVIQRDIKLKRKPTNGAQAYDYLIKGITDEIDELQIMLTELSAVGAKEKFIKEWSPHTKRVSVHD